MKVIIQKTNVFKQIWKALNTTSNFAFKFFFDFFAYVLKIFLYLHLKNN